MKKIFFLEKNHPGVGSDLNTVVVDQFLLFPSLFVGVLFLVLVLLLITQCPSSAIIPLGKRKLVVLL